MQIRRFMWIGLFFIITTAVVICLMDSSTLRSAVDPSGTLPQYHGLTKAEAIQQLGAPLYDETFSMSETVGELTIPLQNHYPLSKPENQNVRIEQLTWYKGEYWTALWLHQVNGKWIVLDSYRWHKDIVF